VNRQIGVRDSKYVVVFDPLFTGQVIRRMRSGRVRISTGNQRETLSLITQERIGVGASNLVGIIDVRVDACGILSRSVGQSNWKYKYGGHSTYKMQNSTENVAKSPKFCTITVNRGRRIERRCLKSHRKFINNRFSACAVQMLLKMAVNAAICSIF